MEIGIGLDHTLGLSYAEQREVVREAVQLGYASAWTNSTLSRDAFQVCGQWSTATADLVDGGIATGISVVPMPLWSVPALALAAGTVADLGGGKLFLGVGVGNLYSAAYRQSLNLPEYPAIRYMREHLRALRGLLDGERVDFEGQTITLRGVRLGFKPPRVPICVGALGPMMLRLCGEAADGAALNWSTPEQIAWSREQVAAGARRAGRDPSAVKMIEYIRVCVDDDEDVARRAYTKALLGYALARPGASKEHGYRGHFARMGFDEALSDLEARRDRGAPEDEIVEAFPRELLRLVGYYGRPDGAAAAFRHLATGLDIAMVRVVAARPGKESTLAVMRACRPELARS